MEDKSFFVFFFLNYNEEYNRYSRLGTNDVVGMNS